MFTWAAAPHMLLAQDAMVVQHVSYLGSIPWFAWIPITAILVGGLGTIVKGITTHRERMALIRMGIHPDHEPERLVDSAKPWVPETSEL